MVFLLLLVLALVLFVFTVLPVWRHESWWVRGLDFPRLQFFVLAAIALILNLTLLDLPHPPAWGLIAIVLFCLCYQVWWIIPYTRLYPVEVKSANRSGRDSLRILTPTS